MFSVALCLPAFFPIVFFLASLGNWMPCSCWKLSEWTHSFTPFPSLYPYALSLYLLLTAFSFSALSAGKCYSSYVLLGIAFIQKRLPALFPDDTALHCMQLKCSLCLGLFQTNYFLFWGSSVLLNWSYFIHICVLLDALLFPQNILFGSGASQPWSIVRVHCIFVPPTQYPALGV